MLAGPHTPSGCSISLLFPASRGHWHFLAHGPFLQLQSSRVEFKSHSLFLLSYHFSLLRGQGWNSVGATEQKSLRISPKHVFPEHLCEEDGEGKKIRSLLFLCHFLYHHTQAKHSAFISMIIVFLERSNSV